MSEHRVSFKWKGMDVEATVYLGSTPSAGPDPSSVEEIEVVGVFDVNQLSEYLSDRLYEDEGCMEAAFEEAEDDKFG